MSALDDLIKEIPDKNLRDRINAEFSKLKAVKKFGLVFEDQKPEVTPLYDLPIKINSLVAEKWGKMNQIYRVKSIEGDEVYCVRYIPTDEVFNFKLDKLVRVALFGEPIYPYLQKLDEVCNAPDSDLWHTLIEADNYHALQLLRYVCKDRKVDCVYIDPPYNTGAKDWKYNDNYVDVSDSFRHSKWLSMMQRRLLLAKEILSNSGAIFISIDDNEQAYLKVLCDEIFGRDNFVAQFCVKRSGGRQDSKFFAVINEFLFCYVKNVKFFVAGEEIKSDSKFPRFDEVEGKFYKTQLLRKWGSNSRRIDRPNLFYEISAPDGEKIFPMLPDGTEGCWRWGKNKMQNALENNLIEFVKKNGEWIAYEKIFQPEVGAGTKKFTTWIDENFTDGAEIIKKFFDAEVFSYPKSISLIKKILRMAINKPDALIVDFFAGSGTTLHAVNLLNAEDGGKRRCILVTNNEVAESEERRLKNEGYQPTDEEWQKLGIARYVTWHRTVCSIKGENIKGETLAGNYLGSEIPMADGFKSNAIFFKLGFLNKDAVALGRQFKEILPVIWLKAGSYGTCPNLDDEENLPPMLVLPENKFAVLLEEEFFMDFEEKVLELAEIETVFIVTDSLDAYRQMIQNLRDRKTYQLYRDYLENFKINIAP